MQKKIEKIIKKVKKFIEINNMPSKNIYKQTKAKKNMKRSSRRWKKKGQMRWKWQRKRLKKEKHKRKMKRIRAR